MNTKTDSVKRPLSLSDRGRPLRPCTGMTTSHRVCICCGEPMTSRIDSRSRNPNVCASCSSMAYGKEEPQSNWIAVPIRHQPETFGGSHEILT
jgi:hypothetical protein